MAYTPQTWTDSPSTSTPISAARLTHMENGIASASSVLSVELGLHGFLRERSSGQRNTVLDAMNSVLDKGNNTVVVNREDLFWSDAQPTEGGAYVWTAADAVVKAAADKGIKTWAILTHPPAWATAAGGASTAGWPCPPYPDVVTAGSNSALNAYAVWCGAVAARYAEGGTFWDTYVGTPCPITHFEVWNEEYAVTFCKRYIGGVITSQNPQPDLYADIYNAAAAAIWAVPKATPAAALTKQTWSPDAGAYLTPFLANVTEPIGAASVHPYTNNFEPASYVPPFGDTYRWQYFTQVPDIRVALDAAGHQSTDLYISELGWSALPGSLTEAEQADRYTDLWATVADMSYVRGLYLFTTTLPFAPDNPALSGYSTTDPECFFGFWHTGATVFDLGAAKPVVATVTALPPIADHTTNWEDVLHKPQVLLDIAGATGTKDATTYLRGDDTWHTPSGGGGGGISTLGDLGITSTATELNYTDGVTSAIQTQIDAKVGKSLTADTVYGVYGDGSQGQYTVAGAATGNTVPYRLSGGTLRVATPVDAEDAANRAYVDGASGSSTTRYGVYQFERPNNLAATSTFNISTRRMFQVPHEVSSFRFHFRNRNHLADTNATNNLTAFTAFVGEAAVNSTGDVTGAFTATPTQIVTSTTMTGGTEVVSGDIAPTTFTIEPYKKYLVSYSINVPSGGTLAMGGGLHWYTTTPSNAGVANPGGLTRTDNQGVLDVYMEYVFADDGAPGIAVLSNSIAGGGHTGTAANAGELGSWVQKWALREKGFALNYAVGGAWAAHFTPTSAKWDAYSTLASFADVKVDAVVIFALTSSDIAAGTALATVTPFLADIVATARTKWPDARIILSNNPPRSDSSGTPETNRVAYNRTLANMPHNSDACIDIDSLITDWASPGRARTPYQGEPGVDAIHWSGTGHERAAEIMSTAVTYGAVAAVTPAVTTPGPGPSGLRAITSAPAGNGRFAFRLFGGADSPSRLPADKTKYQLFMISPYQVNMAAAIRAANPTAVILCYKDASSMRRNLSDSAITWCPADGGTTGKDWGVQYCDSITNHPTWFMTEGGSNFQYAGYAYHWHANVAATGYKERWLSNVLVDLDAHSDFDGVMIDNLLSDIRAYVPGGSFPDQYTTLAAGQAAYQTFIDHVSGMTASGNHVISNMANARLTAGQWDAYVANQSGGFDEMWESFGDSGGGVPNNLPEYAEGWSRQMAELESSVTAGKLGIFSTQSTGLFECAIYGYASFLLGTNGTQVWMESNYDADGQDFVALRPMYGWQLGAPTGARSQPQTNLWMRQFANGRVYVNSDNTTNRTGVSLGGTYTDESGAAVTTVTVNAMRARILRR